MSALALIACRGLSPLRAWTAFLALALAGVTAEVSATAQRTFVSGKCADTNACTISAPCRSIVAAIAQTNTGGEVIVLDSAGYGPFAISKSISIIAAPGVYAGVSVTAVGTQIAVDVEGSATTVVLRGLSINASGGGGIGINFLNAKALTVDRCRVSGFLTGIFQNGGVMTVRDTTVSDGGVNHQGVVLYGGVATLERVAIARTGTGIAVSGNAALAMRSGTISDVAEDGIRAQNLASVSIDDVVISNSADTGIYAFGDTGTPYIDIIRSQIVGAVFYGVVVSTLLTNNAVVHVTDSLISENGVGVATFLGGHASLSGNTIVNNGIGVYSPNSGTSTYQNNQVRENPSGDTGGTINPRTFK